MPQAEVPPSLAAKYSQCIQRSNKVGTNKVGTNNVGTCLIDSMFNGLRQSIAVVKTQAQKNVMNVHETKLLTADLVQPNQKDMGAEAIGQKLFGILANQAAPGHVPVLQRYTVELLSLRKIFQRFLLLQQRLAVAESRSLDLSTSKEKENFVYQVFLADIPVPMGMMMTLQYYFKNLHQCTTTVSQKNKLRQALQQTCERVLINFLFAPDNAPVIRDMEAKAAKA